MSVSQPSRQTRQWNQAWAALSTKWKVANHIDMYKALIDCHFKKMLATHTDSDLESDREYAEGLEIEEEREMINPSVNIQGVTGNTKFFFYHQAIIKS